MKFDFLADVDQGLSVPAIRRQAAKGFDVDCSVAVRLVVAAQGHVEISLLVAMRRVTQTTGSDQVGNRTAIPSEKLPPLLASAATKTFQGYQEKDRKRLVTQATKTPLQLDQDGTTKKKREIVHQTQKSGNREQQTNTQLHSERPPSQNR
jgi:hypothetical protein